MWGSVDERGGTRFVGWLIGWFEEESESATTTYLLKARWTSSARGPGSKFAPSDGEVVLIPRKTCNRCNSYSMSAEFGNKIVLCVEIMRNFLKMTWNWSDQATL